MSQTYHDAIATGAAANASTFNDPLGDLDAAISAVNVARLAGDTLLDARIDSLIAESGTSDSEVIDARAAGNVDDPAATLAERIEWLEGANVIYARAYGFRKTNTAGANTTALNAAMAAAVAFGEPSVVVIGAGRFALNGITVPAKVLLHGWRMPVYDFVSALQGGTILAFAAGDLNLSARSGLMDLGIETAPGANAIDGTTVDDCLVINVAVLGTGSNHGCVWTTGSRNRVSNFFAAEFQHGLVFKGQNNIASNIACWNCSISSLTLKSGEGLNCEGNIIIGLLSDGTALGDAGGVWLHALDGGEHVRYNTITGFNLHNVGHGFMLHNDGAVDSEVADNVISSGVIRNPNTDPGAGNGVWLTNDAATITSLIKRNTFIGVGVIDAENYSFNNQYGATNNRLIGCNSENPGADHIFRTWTPGGVNGPGQIFPESIDVAESVEDGDTSVTVRNKFSEAASLDETASVIFAFDNPTGTPVEAAYVRVGKEEDFATALGRSAYMAFYTRADDTMAERMRITKSGMVGIANAAPETALHVSGAMTIDEVAGTPALPTAGTECRIYMRNDTLVIQYNDGGTTRYKSLVLTGTGVTWVHSTSAP